MVVEVLHPARPIVFRTDIREKIIPFGFQSAIAGGKTKGFVLIYNTLDYAKKLELKYRLIQMGLAQKVDKRRPKQRTKRNRQKKVRRIEKATVSAGKK